MTPLDVPGSLGLEWIGPWLRALADADTPQAPRAAGEGEQAAANLAEAA